jgi:exosortase N
MKSTKEVLQMAKNNKRLLVGAFLVVFLVVSHRPVWSYLHINFSLNNFALLLLPLATFVKKQGVFSYRYLLVGGVSYGLYLCSGAPFFLVLAIGFVCFLVLELTLGKINYLAPFALVLITPIVKYFFDVFGFPVRLALTKFATRFLTWTSGFDLSAQGNMITKNGALFSVEPECMGLKMVITSLLSGIMMVSFFERKFKSNYTFWSLVLIVMMTLFLVVLNNLIRIILLVKYEIPAQDPAHDFVGVAGLFGIVFIPQYFFVRFCNQFSTSAHDNGRTVNMRWPLKGLSGALVLWVAISSFTFIKTADMEPDPISSDFAWPGYQTELLPTNVVKLSNQHALIYIKPPKPFYTSDHAPFLCWKGSGYSISNEEIKKVRGYDICMAKLTSGNQTLFTAWFHDNGKHKTAHQLDWRWRALNGEEEFRLINISAEHYFVMLEEVDKFLMNDIFNVKSSGE